MSRYTVGTLIEKLKELDRDMPIVDVEDVDLDYTSEIEIEIVSVVRCNSDDPFYIDSLYHNRENEAIKAVHIHSDHDHPSAYGYLE